MKKQHIIIMDTSVLCVWLRVPGKETCGKDDNYWDYEKIAAKIAEEEQQGALFVLPLASIIETGNHIAQIKQSGQDQRWNCAQALAELMRKSADAAEPWAAFAQQTELWAPSKLKALAERWPEKAKCGDSIGDSTIVDVAALYSEVGYRVEILTGDARLKAYEPAKQRPIPRRRQ